MALSDSSMKDRIIANLEAAGFDTGNEFSKTQEYIEAIAKGVVEEIQANAVVTTATETGTVS